MKKSMLILVFCGAFMFNGCATILSGTSDDITFNSNPTGATILIDGLKVGKTPSVQTIKRPGFSDKTVTLKLEGHDDRTFKLQKTLNAVTICNIGIGGVPGFIIDALTGSIYKYDRTNYSEDLEPKAFNLEDLDKDQFGHYLVPDVLNRSVLVYDKEMDVEIHFQ